MLRVAEFQGWPSGYHELAITSWQSGAGNQELGTTDREPQTGNHWRLLNFPIWHHPIKILHAAASAVLEETGKAGLLGRLTGQDYRAGLPGRPDYRLRAMDSRSNRYGQENAGCFILSHLYTIEKHQIETTSESLYFVFNYLLIQYKVLFNSL